MTEPVESCCARSAAATAGAGDAGGTEAAGPAASMSGGGAGGERCFHCERPLEAGEVRTVATDGATYHLCSDACRQATATILARGLGRFYAHRRSPLASAAAGVSGTGGTGADAHVSGVARKRAAGARGDGRGDGRRDGGSHRRAGRHREHEVYDRDAVFERYSRAAGEHTREVTLAIGGVHCAACSWLIEQAIGPLPGVEDIHVNPGTGRTLLTIDRRLTGLAEILQRIEALGYEPRPVASGEELTPDLRERRAALGRLAVAGIGMMQVMMYSAGQYMGAFQGIDPAIDRLLGLVSLLVATPVVFYSGQTFFQSALQGLRRGIAGMDVPIALAITGAYGWSVWVMLGPDGLVPANAHTYFDSVVMLIFLLLLGRFVEMSVRHHAGQRTDALARLLPSAVLRVREDGEDEMVDRHELVPGDRVRVLAGDALAVDGVIDEGRGEVDESLLTGESAAQARAVGDEVFGGTVLLSGSLVMRVTATGEDTALARIERLMDRAQAERPPLAGLADRIARWFVLALVIAATLIGVVWWQIDPARAFPVVLAVLVVTCPCALSLATPAALAAATTAFARRGLLVTRTAAIETLARIDTVVFDKTGTLTCAEPRLVRVDVLREGVDEARCLALAAALEAHSRHPLAGAFDEWRSALRAADVETVVGQGLAGEIDGRRLRIGQLAFAGGSMPSVAQAPPAGAAAPAHATAPADSIDATRTQIALGDDDGVLAVFTLDDGLRADAGEVVDSLQHELGLSLHIASGDAPEPVQAVAARLGIANALARQAPSQKVQLLESLRAQGARVAMVGDGINDAPVLAGADVSVAIAGGADLARVSADMVLLGQGLSPLRDGVRHARRTVRVIRQNLLWAACYNAVALPLAATGMVTPWMAAIGMSASSLIVVLNAMRLAGGRRDGSGTAMPPDEGADGGRRTGAGAGPVNGTSNGGDRLAGSAAS